MYKSLNETAKFVANFGNSEQTSEHVRQKLCEALCNNCRFRLLLDIRQEIKPFPKIAIISQEYEVSQVEVVSGQNLTGESEGHRYVFFTP